MKEFLSPNDRLSHLSDVKVIIIIVVVVAKSEEL